VAPWSTKANVPLALTQSVSDAEIGAGSVVCSTLDGCVRKATATRRTLVSGPVPVFSTVKVTVAVSQLSRNASLSPPVMATVTLGRIPTFAPATGVTDSGLLMRPKHERFVPTGRTLKKYAVPFVLIGSLLFIAGGAFSLLIVTPSAISFLLSYARPGLQPMISIGNYIDFLLKFTLAFGAVFEVPLAMTLVARMGLVTAKQFAKNRKYAILGAFIAGAVLTPTPDMVNQTLMAGPIIILYELGIVAARVFGRRRRSPVAEPATGETTA